VGDCREAGGREEALDAIGWESPDVVLVDLSPGTEQALQLLTELWTRNIPVLAVSEDWICFRSYSLQDPLQQPWLLFRPHAPHRRPSGLLLISVVGRLRQQQRDAIGYLFEDNQGLRERLGGKRLRRNDD